MSDKPYVRLTSVKNLLKAELIQSLLHANDIPCEIRDRGQAEVFEGMAGILTEGIILRVPADQYQEALQVLQTSKEAGQEMEGGA